VRDVTVVPVGLTRWHAPDLRLYTDAEAAAVLESVMAWQDRLRAELGVGFVYPADEWFLRSGVPVPNVDAYDLLLPALIENGVGMVRRFSDTFEGLCSQLLPLGTRQTWVTGALFGPTLAGFASRLVEVGVSVEVVPVTNQFFGTTVTVAGLLTVEDIVAALDGRSLGDVVVMPGEVFRGPGGLSLDGVGPAALSSALATPVVLAEVGSEAWCVSRVD